MLSRDITFHQGVVLLISTSCFLSLDFICFILPLKLSHSFSGFVLCSSPHDRIAVINRQIMLTRFSLWFPTSVPAMPILLCKPVTKCLLDGYCIEKPSHLYMYTLWSSSRHWKIMEDRSFGILNCLKLCKSISDSMLSDSWINIENWSLRTWDIRA